MPVDPRSLLQENCASTFASPREARQGAYLKASRESQVQNYGETYDEINARFDRTGNLATATDAELNSIGGVQAGIESLIRLSNTIRGTGRIGRTTTIGGIVGRVIAENGAIDSGANAILQGLGIGRNITSVVNGMIPANVDKAFATACRVFQLVRSGSFLPGIADEVLPDFLQVERDIGRAPRPTPAEVNGKFEGCFASPYATDLIRKAPKYKFNFVVEFEWTTPYADEDQIRNGMFIAFVVKNTTRPNIRYDYEDVNMYNFRTRAIKRMEYEPMTMRFLDDDENNALRFYNRYYKAMSPIGNLPSGSNGTADDVFSANVNTSQELQEAGMGPILGGAGQTNNDQTRGFPLGAQVTQNYSASIGPLKGVGEGTNNDTRQPLKRITIYHIFDQGRKLNVYTMYNPKMTELTLDELDHSIGTEGAEVQLTFTYDALNIVTDASFDPNAQGFNIKGLETAAGALFPMRYVDHPNNAAVQNKNLQFGDDLLGLFDRGRDLPSNVATNPSGLLGAVNSAVSQVASPQTQQALEQFATRTLPDIGNSALTTGRFFAEQALARSQTQLENLVGATDDVLIDGATVSVEKARQILGGKIAKYNRLVQTNGITEQEVEQIDNASGVASGTA